MAKPKSVIRPTIIQAEYCDASPIDTKDPVVEHIKNKNIHIDQDLRDNINYARKDIDFHSSNEDIHVSLKEKDTWNDKESKQGAQAKANKVMNSLQNHINDSTVHLTKSEKELLKDKYTKAEVRNLVKHTLTGLTFLPRVNSRSELDIKYPDPKINSCVYIKSLNTTLIYNGNQWVDFNGIFTPEVTDEFDGLMSSGDKIKLDNIEENANNYIHPDNIDTRHVSDTQIEYWNKKADNVLATHINDGLISSDDKIKLDSIEENANNYIHPETHDPSIIKQDKNNRFVSDAEKASWNNKVESSYVDSAVDKTLTTVKSIIDTKVANIFNTSEDQLEVIRSLAFELKNNDTVKNFINLYNGCTKNEEFEEHVLNDKIHMSRNDIALLQNVKSLLEKGFPEYNIPESLPANGGNSDTVGNYKPESLLNNRSFYDYTIGTSDYNKEQVTVIADNLEAVANVFEKINKGQGFNILFKPGSYLIEKELVIKASNITLRGIGDLSKLLGLSIKIIGNNNTIENISLLSGNDKIVNGAAITIEGNNNTIKANTIMNYDKGIIVEGSNNIIINNTLINIRREAINLVADINSNCGNIVDGNNIRNSSIGIVLMSSKNSLTKNHITKNNIINCTSGIVLSNTVSDNTKTTINIISQNIVVRGNGGITEYLPGHKTIISEFSSKNIISQNITLGKEIAAPNDVLSDNVF